MLILLGGKVSGPCRINDSQENIVVCCKGGLVRLLREYTSTDIVCVYAVYLEYMVNTKVTHKDVEKLAA